MLPQYLCSIWLNNMYVSSSGPEDVILEADEEVKATEERTCGGCQKTRADISSISVDSSSISWVFCSSCQSSWHSSCIPSHLQTSDVQSWVCPDCLSKNGENRNDIYANSIMVSSE